MCKDIISLSNCSLILKIPFIFYLAMFLCCSNNVCLSRSWPGKSNTLKLLFWNQTHFMRLRSMHIYYQEVRIVITWTGLTLPHFCARTCITNVICYGLSLCSVSSVKLRDDCSFCWYWWNWWPSLFKLSFQIISITNEQKKFWWCNTEPGLRKLCLTFFCREKKSHFTVS